MNNRARVRAIPALLAATLGYSTFGTMSSLLAQDSGAATPAALPTGLEELNLTIGESGVSGMPATLEANRYLVKVSGAAATDGPPAGAIFGRLPEDVTIEQAYEDVQAMTDHVPEWFLQTHFGGGVVAGPDGSGWAVIDLDAGKWAVTTPGFSTLGVEFEVTGELATDLPAPASTVTLELAEMTISVTEGELAAGDNVVYTHNIGAAIHFVDISQVPEGTTEDQVAALMESYMTGTPATDGLKEEEMIPVGYIPDMSGGLATWSSLTLDAGTYLLTCWVTDEETGMPHAMMGMWKVVNVK